jgi:hypothetical protein
MVLGQDHGGRYPAGEREQSGERGKAASHGSIVSSTPDFRYREPGSCSAGSSSEP